MKKTIFTLVLILLGISVFSQENFDSFYKRFCNQPSFQVSRIRWPLKGTTADNAMNSQGDYDYGSRKWRRSDWGKKITPYYDKELRKYGYVYGIEKNTKKITIKVFTPNSDIGYKSIFQLISGKWYLTHCYDYF